MIRTPEVHQNLLARYRLIAGVEGPFPFTHMILNFFFKSKHGRYFDEKLLSILPSVLYKYTERSAQVALKPTSTFGRGLFL